MGLTPIMELLQSASTGGYAVGYFESWNLESLRAVIDAAEEEHSPVIAGFNGGMLTDPDRLLRSDRLEYYAALGRSAAENAGVPVSLLLNELHSLQLAQTGIELGFNSLMFECGSDNPEECISQTNRIVEKAHSAGVAVEANVGRLPTADDFGLRRRAAGPSLTDPAEARQFVDLTGTDILAVSIGNVEVMMNGKAVLDFDLLDRINKAVGVPLTLHGGSGIADRDIGELVKRGLRKMNLGTALNRAFLEGMAATDSSAETIAPKFRIGSGLKEDILAGGETAMKELVKHKMRVYGSAGTAAGS